MVFCCQLLLILGMRKQASRWIAVRSSVFILEMEMNQDTLIKGVNPPVVIGRRKRTKTNSMFCLFYIRRMRGVSVYAAERLAASLK